MADRKKISTRLRFEVFKRDSFTCRYCGRKSPEVVLELEHIVPVAEGGSDDPMNLATACFECNSGKSDKPLNEVMTGEDPHDKAIEILEKERQLREYEAVRRAQEARKQQDWGYLERRFKDDGLDDMAPYVRSALGEFSIHDVAEAIQKAIDKTNGWHPNCTRYFCGIVRRWREEQQTAHPQVMECRFCGEPIVATVPEGAVVFCSKVCHETDREEAVYWFTLMQEEGENYVVPSDCSDLP